MRNDKILTLSLGMALASCGGSGGGGGPVDLGPPEDVAGQWQITEEITSASGVCASEEGTINSYAVTVEQDGANLTVTAPAGVFTGRINGNQLSWTGSYPEDGGQTTITGMDLTVTGDSLSGNTTWTWRGSGESCGGTTSVRGQRTSRPGGGTTPSRFIDFDGNQQNDSTVVIDSNGDAIRFRTDTGQMYVFDMTIQNVVLDDSGNVMARGENLGGIYAVRSTSGAQIAAFLTHDGYLFDVIELDDGIRIEQTQRLAQRVGGQQIGANGLSRSPVRFASAPNPSGEPIDDYDGSQPVGQQPHRVGQLR